VTLGQNRKNPKTLEMEEKEQKNEENRLKKAKPGFRPANSIRSFDRKKG
jgi:hypothetical protein